MEFAGRDGTKGFNDFGHTSDARTYMKKFKIGELAEVLKCGKTALFFENFRLFWKIIFYD